MQLDNILKEIADFVVVIEKDHQGNIIYTNTDNPKFYNKEASFAFLERGKYYERKIVETEQSVIYTYVDISNYIKDHLTGIFNRHGFQIQLEHMNYNKESLAIALCDIDYFKNVNDTYGHLAGDIILKEIASVLVTNIGKQGFVSRHGGEEFIIVLEEKDPKVVYFKLEQLRKLIEMHSFSNVPSSCHVTMTMGFDLYNPKEGTISDTIKHADLAMYQGKDRGRNLVKMYKKKGINSIDYSEKEDR